MNASIDKAREDGGFVASLSEHGAYWSCDEAEILRRVLNRWEIEAAREAGFLVVVTAGPNIAQKWKVVQAEGVPHCNEIKAAREALKLTLRGMANKLGMSMADYRRIEWGHAAMSPEKYAEIRAMLVWATRMGADR